MFYWFENRRCKQSNNNKHAQQPCDNDPSFKSNPDYAIGDTNNVGRIPNNSGFPNTAREETSDGEYNSISLQTMNDTQITHEDSTYNHITSGHSSAFSTDNTYAHIPNTNVARFDNTYSHLPTSKQEKSYEDLNDSSTYNHLNEAIGISTLSRNDWLRHSEINDNVSNVDTTYSHINQTCNETRKPNIENNDSTYNHLGETLNASSGIRNAQQSDPAYNVVGLNVHAQNKNNTTRTGPYSYAVVNTQPHYETAEGHLEEHQHEYFVLEPNNDDVAKSKPKRSKPRPYDYAIVNNQRPDVESEQPPEDGPHEYFVLEKLQ